MALPPATAKPYAANSSFTLSPRAIHHNAVKVSVATALIGLMGITLLGILVASTNLSERAIKGIIWTSLGLLVTGTLAALILQNAKKG